MRNKKPLITITMILLFLTVPVFAAEKKLSENDFMKILESYISIAQENNLDVSIMRKKVEQANAEKREAFANFLPKVSFQSRYTAAGGGRMIVIDPAEFLGDIMPGVDIPKTEFPFLRPHEQETKFNLTQTLFAGGAVLNGYNARDSLYEAKECELHTLKWNKRLEVTEAYLNYLKTVELVGIKENVLSLAKEGLSLTESLFKQDKLLKNDVMRAQVNVSKAETELAEAKQRNRLAARLFNNILNRNPHAPITEVKLSVAAADTLDKFKSDTDDIEKVLADYETEALKTRSELRGLNLNLDAVSKMKNVSFSEYLPRVILSVDYGWQGEEYSFTAEDDYYMASLVFQLNIFDGGAREAKMTRAIEQYEEVELQRELARRQIGLQVENAYLDLVTTRGQMETAIKQMESARENYRIVDKRFRLGMALTLDMNDALAQYDIASSQKVITLYDYINAIFKMENVLGSPCGRE